MKGILDTHAFLWWDADPSKLSTSALAFIQDPTNFVYLSVVSIWEIIIKQQLGKLSATIPLADRVAQQRSNGLLILSATLDHIMDVQALPALHKDPFDRLLIAQTRVENAVVVSGDAIFSQYPVTVIW
ncbi:MAG: type II toxin-antitoxin system VapC family toxin [Planctomycetes bacterium]|nr:type II toxin-antitoxin system VapC family toxin [Planctomycetota bacterium]